MKNGILIIKQQYVNNITAITKHLECESGATYKYKGDYSHHIVRFSLRFISYDSFFIMFHKVLTVLSYFQKESFLNLNHDMFSIGFVYIKHIT